MVTPGPAPLDDSSAATYRRQAELSTWTPDQAGAVRESFAPNPPWLLSLPWLVTGLVLLAAAYPVNPDFFPASAAIILGIFGGTAVAAWVYARSQRTRVAEHALVVGGLRTQVIPFESIDPGRVAISATVRHLGRHLHSGGTRILQSQGATAVINGLNPDPGARNHHGPPGSVPSPYCEWGLSGDPVRVLTALEAAMVADGHPAQGMAALAQARTFTPPSQHPPTDVLLPRRALDPPLGIPRG